MLGIVLKKQNSTGYGLSPESIKMIRCPVTESRLTEATASVVDRLNLQIENSKMTNQDGQVVKAKLDGGFINADQSLFFPVRGGIIVLIADQAIQLNGFQVAERRGATQ